MSAAFDPPRTGTSNTVFKSGPLFISSKGLGWKSWKKRWFILTRTSLVFFKNDPSGLPQQGGEVNLTLGGIDLNNSGSVVVREDKKLLTVLFPDGRDGRAFTLKADTLEDLYEWKSALELALAQAPSAALVMGQNGIFKNDSTDGIEGSFPQRREKKPVKSLVVGRPILLALEDIDGGPSFLEKALQFLEKYGSKVEGILRQCADVEEVEQRVHEYEQGKTEFSTEEDAHIVGDCVKHVLRELPSSPVPASCCTALLEAYKIEQKEARVTAMRLAILETFPEPNRRLLQRILKMMHTISVHSSDNRMTSSAVAACMAPLLLRPLLAGECEMEDDFDINGDNAAQLLAAANAANNAHAIVTMLLEEYDHIFYDDNPQRSSISAGSRIENSESEDISDDETLEVKGDGYRNAVDAETDDDHDRVLSGQLSESSGSVSSDLYNYKPFGGENSESGSFSNNYAPRRNNNPDEYAQAIRGDGRSFTDPQDREKKYLKSENVINGEVPNGESQRSMGEILSSMDHGMSQSVTLPEASVEKPASRSAAPNLNVKRSSFWGRNNARKTPSVESLDSSGEEELTIQRLEITKNDLRLRIAKEAKGNAILQASLERRKQALHERRLALEHDVARLQEQLQAERDLRSALEVGLSMSSGQFSSSHDMDSKTRAELEEIALAEADVARLKQKVAELHHQLHQQRQNHYGSVSRASNHYPKGSNHASELKCFQQDFDSSLAFCNQERMQRTEDLLRTDPRNVKDQILMSGNSNMPAREHFVDTTSPSNTKLTEVSTSISMDELRASDAASPLSSLKPNEVMEYHRHPTIASSTLVELTSRLDFFKERRSQLMEQLHNLDFNYGTTAQ